MEATTQTETLEIQSEQLLSATNAAVNNGEYDLAETLIDKRLAILNKLDSQGGS